MAKRKVLITGAAGRIGSYFAERMVDKYDFRLMVLPGDPAAESIRVFGEVVEADLTDMARMRRVCAGMDTVVHLAGNPNASATWSELLNPNVIGAYNAFVAAKSAGCRRFIFASSIHAISGYPDDVQVKTTEPSNPGDLYGVTKCFGESMCQYMSGQEGLSCIAIRICAYQPAEVAETEAGVRLMDAFTDRDDMNRIIERCIDVENVRFAIIHGLSESRFKRLDLTDTRALLGYDPQMDVTEVNPALAALKLNDSIYGHNQRGDQQSGIREDI